MTGGEAVGSILWAILVVLVILWFFGHFALHLGSLIHLLLLVAVIVLIYQLFVGTRRAP